jgi:hypothetical protein
MLKALIGSVLAGLLMLSPAVAQDTWPNGPLTLVAASSVRA